MSVENEVTAKEGEGQDEAAKAAAAEKAAQEAAEKKPGEGEEKTPEQIETDRVAAEEAAKVKPPEKTPEEKERDRKAYEKRQQEKERKRLHDLEIENAELRGFKKAMEKGGKTEGEDTAPDITALESEFAAKNPEPVEDSFKTWAEYNKAHTRWAVKLEKFVDSKTSETDTRRNEDEGRQSKFKETVTAQREQGEQEFEDFAETVDGMQVSVPALQAMYESPIGHKLAYYLGQNPKEIERIAGLSPFAQAKEIGKIESKIETGAIQLKKPVSKAPAPAPRPGAKGAEHDSDEARYADPKTSTKERIEISKRLQAKREQG